MPEDFTSLRKNSKPESSLIHQHKNGNDDDDYESMGKKDFAFRTPKRVNQTDWKVVQKWSKSQCQNLTVKSMHQHCTSLSISDISGIPR
jgi:hypothetical protein